VSIGGLRLTIACGDYDRTRDVLSGAVPTDGLTLLPVTPSGGAPEIFFRSTRYLEFDVCELSLSAYLSTLDRDDQPFVAIPVFLSRAFRHGNIAVREDAGIQRPEDLRGKRVAVSEYATSASVWIRGMLRDEYGIDPTDIEWYSRREEKIDTGRGGILLRRLPPGDFATHLREGRVDALIGSMVAEGPGIRRLFPRYWEVEADYYRRTGIFPIMHLLAIKRHVYEENPWVARTLFKAFAEARLRCAQRQEQTSVPPYMLAWVRRYVDEQRELLGDDVWTYGVQPNAVVLETFARYAHEQGLTSRRMSLDEMFVPYRHTNNDPRFA
jgi:4,5-dihydroxyphthalate decarboxylase